MPSLSKADIDKIKDALNDEQYDFQTADAIAQKTNLESKAEAVVEFLDSSADVFKSEIPDNYGADLYTIKNIHAPRKEFWRKFKVFVTKSTAL